eukprot:CAMPEP_0203929528 /NCGR_PEP_ID=MMETSP0359-20131031/68421_1 /ASSEMBLY_ACC=CAM_ASM_000338 /TAXON_ID=268821 /ORGANISM="Scrippsiella Hangoei, Strain SHTV-5" /LENGTH=537 /DNA_ID=CAMNT_0050858573 /DNA_START=1 /DNA_END=1614 /DNA_ORIENTATION=+
MLSPSQSSAFAAAPAALERIGLGGAGAGSLGAAPGVACGFAGPSASAAAAVVVGSSAALIGALSAAAAVRRRTSGRGSAFRRQVGPRDRGARLARLRDSDEAWEAADYADDKEAQMAVLKLMEETVALEEARGGSAESQVMRAIQMEAAGTSVSDKVEGILKGSGTWGTMPSVIPSAGPSAAAARPLPCVAICGFGGAAVGELLMQRFRSEVSARGGEEPVWVDLAEAAGTPLESLQAALEKCEVALLCPAQRTDGGPPVSEALGALKMLLAAGSERMLKVVLHSRNDARGEKSGGFDVGAMFGFGGQQPGSAWKQLEDEITSTARTRTSRRPLRHIVVRSGSAAEGATSTGGDAALRCIADATGDGAGAAPPEAVVAEALFQSVAQAVDVGFTVVGSEGSADWPELLSPFVGPEVWRCEVEDARRAAIFVQQWSDEFFGKGKSAARFGVKTKIELRPTEAGVVVKFRPSTPLMEGQASFEAWTEGGLEFVAEAPVGGQPRLRIRRCAYGWKVAIKESSEQALLDKFKSDWKETFGK